MKKLSGWTTAMIADVATIGGGSGFPDAYQGNSNGDFPFIKVSDMNSPGNEKYVVTANNWISEEVRKKIKAKVQPQGAIVFAKVGGALLTNKRRILSRPTIIDNNMMSLIATEIDSQYLYQVMLGVDLGRYRQEGAVPSVNGGRVGEIVLDLPPLPEQRKIADTLSTWDKALEKLDALIAAKDRRKKALMQKLLVGRKRFPGFIGKWRRVRLIDVLDPITRPRAKPQSKFLAAGIRSHGKGVFLKHDFIPANIALDELFELKAGDLVVNITFAWEGAAAIVPPEADGALVSHRFPSFVFRDGKGDRAFFRHYILTKRFVFDCGLASPGGAGRNRVLSKSVFLDIELCLPPIEEQQKIGEFLDTAAQELTRLRAQRNALDQQKRGLMQRLLTGKTRVKP